MKKVLFYFSLLLLTFVSVTVHAQRVNTKYIQTFPYSITSKAFIGTKTNEFKVEDNLSPGRLSYRVAPAPRLGAGIAYKWFAVSGAFMRLGQPEEEEKGVTEEMDLQWNFYLRFLTIDFRLQQYEGYFLDNSSAIQNWAEINKNLYQRTDLITSSIGGNIRYNLNYKKYSTKAIYAQTERQLKSAGSVSLGIRFNALGVLSDSSIVPSNLINKLENFDLNQLSFIDLGAGIGYGYTFVRGRWFFNVGFMGFIVNQNIKFEGNGILNEQTGSQVNFQSQTALGYSNNNIYFGLTAVADQMYSRWADSKDIIYSFSKTRFMLAKRFHLKPVKKDKSDIWDQF